MTSRGTDALLIVDVINDLAFPGGGKVLPWAERMVTPLAATRRLARAAAVPVIYANDNYGHWRSNFHEVYEYCTRRSARGREISRRLRPTLQDYFVLKPRHSAFFASSLRPLLEHLHTRRLILAGIATNLCVLFTAHDAHMHGYDLLVLSDCCAAESDEDHNLALDQLKRFCGAKVCRSDELRLGGKKRKTIR
jgi:nicotinamidase-related amidase